MYTALCRYDYGFKMKFNSFSFFQILNFLFFFLFFSFFFFFHLFHFQFFDSDTTTPHPYDPLQKKISIALHLNLANLMTKISRFLYIFDEQYLLRYEQCDKHSTRDFQTYTWVGPEKWRGI